MRHQHIVKRQRSTVGDGNSAFKRQNTYTAVVGAPISQESTATDDSSNQTSQGQQQSQQATDTVYATDGGPNSSPTPSIINLATQTGDSQTSPTANPYSYNTSPSPSQISSPTAQPGSSNTYTAGQASATGASSSDSSSDGSSSSSGMSTMGKVGLGVGIIVGIGVILALILFLINKKKRQQREEIPSPALRNDAEKNVNDFVASRIGPPISNHTSTTAPRLSLRPASSFLPEFMGGKNRHSQGNMLNTYGQQNPNNHGMQQLSANDVPMRPIDEKRGPGENPFRDPENPFADPSKSAVSPMIPPGQHFDSVRDSDQFFGPPPNRPNQGSDVASTAAGTGVAAGAVIAARAAMSNDRNQQPPQHLQHQMDSARQAPIPMPEPEFSHAPSPKPESARSERPNQMLMSGPGPRPETPNSAGGNVYRILMDFTPSMEDELELRAGQVVRMLHEYDDGWCLCIRLDRSAQGVVPRTCLAAKPSKPRPAPGPGPGPQQGRPYSPHQQPYAGGLPPNGRMSPSMARPMSPAGMRGPQGRPMSPAGGRQSPGPRNMGPPPQQQQSHGGRSMSPGAYNRAPRPLSPGPQPRPQQRSMSPGPYGHAGGPAPMSGAQQRRRSNSASAAASQMMDRRNSPPGPSKLHQGMGIAM